MQAILYSANLKRLMEQLYERNAILQRNDNRAIRKRRPSYACALIFRENGWPICEHRMTLPSIAMCD